MHQADAIAKHVLALERAALDRWGKGDPNGYLEICADDVSYFDPFVGQRLDGIQSLTKWYDAIRGKVQIDRDEILHPRVQVTGEAAVLTLQFVSHGSEGAMHWNCTEIYQRRRERWKIVHTHWSFVRPVITPPEVVDTKLTAAKTGG